jgi:S1-C subfamily serine protease
MRTHSLSKLVFVTLLVLTLLSTANATDFSMQYKRFRGAVIKVEVLQQKVPVSFGTGFFVDNEGTFVTNNHVVDAAMGAGFRLRVTTADGKTFDDVEYGLCKASPIDLCVFRVKYNPPVHISLASTSEIPEVGNEVFVIGHPRGYDFSLTNGVVNGLRKIPVKTTAANGSESVSEREEIQISAPVSHGNSGGPILGKKGQLFGVATWIRVDQGSQNLNFGSSVNEVKKLFGKPIAFTSLDSFKDQQNGKKREFSNALAKRYTQPLFELLKQNESSPNPKPIAEIFRSWGWKPFWLMGTRTDSDGKNLNETLDFFVPPWLGKIVERKSGAQFNESIFNTGDVIVDLIEVADLAKLNGTKPERLPLAIVQTYKDAGEWDSIKAKLSPQQIDYLYSRPEAYKCKTEKPHSLYEPHLGGVTCTLFVYNFDAPNWGASQIFSSQNSKHYGLRIVSTAYDPNIANLIYDTGALIDLSKSWREESTPKPATPIKSLASVDSETTSLFSTYFQVKGKCEKNIFNGKDRLPLCLGEGIFSTRRSDFRTIAVAYLKDGMSLKFMTKIGKGASPSSENGRTTYTAEIAELDLLRGSHSDGVIPGQGTCKFTVMSETQSAEMKCNAKTKDGSEFAFSLNGKATKTYVDSKF